MLVNKAASSNWIGQPRRYGARSAVGRELLSKFKVQRGKSRFKSGRRSPLLFYTLNPSGDEKRRHRPCQIDGEFRMPGLGFHGAFPVPVRVPNFVPDRR